MSDGGTQRCCSWGWRSSFLFQRLAHSPAEQPQPRRSSPSTGRPQGWGEPTASQKGRELLPSAPGQGQPHAAVPPTPSGVGTTGCGPPGDGPLPLCASPIPLVGQGPAHPAAHRDPSISAGQQKGQLPRELGDTAMHSQRGKAPASPGTIWAASMVTGEGAALPGWPRVHPGSGLLNVFIKDLDDGIEKVLIKFADDTKLGGTTSILEDRIRIRNDLDKLEKWTGKNRMKFNRDKCKVLRRDGNNQLSKHRAGTGGWQLQSPAGTRLCRCLAGRGPAPGNPSRGLWEEERAEGER